MMRMLMMLAGTALMGAAWADNGGGQALTLYQSGAALVADTQDLPLDKGRQTLTLANLPDRLRPETFWLAGDGIELLGSRYRDGGDDRAAMLAALVGQTVTLRRADGSGGDVTREATLLSADGVPMVRVDDRVEWLDAESPWRLALSSVPDTALPAGALQLDIRADQGGRQPLEMLYQVDGMSWRTEYVASLDENAEQLTLRAQAVITNNAGTDWRQAQLALIAGDVARQGGQPKAMMMRSEAASAADGMQAEQAADYYRYELDQPVTLADGEQRSVLLMPEQRIEVEREYRFDHGWQYLDSNRQRAHAGVRVSFDNTLGQPMPAGTIRVYADGTAPLLIGEAGIGNTPVGAPVELTLGRAFDITAERTTTDTRRDGQAREIERELVIENARSEPVTVRVVESMPGDWTMLSASADHEKVDAQRAAWSLEVPAEGETRLTYRVRYR